MEDKKTLMINKADGTTEEVEEVISFEFSDTKKKYLVYTKNETDPNGNITIYVTEVVSDNMGTRLLGVSTDDEWARIKDVLRELAKKEA
ncbi:MAG: DUF1292 domain-containing protein [bacterium]|nr:DUF1292 domain-containing protein [bacterium]